MARQRETQSLHESDSAPNYETKSSPPAPKPAMQASIYADGQLPPLFCEIVNQLEEIIKAPIWLLIQNNPRQESFGELNHVVYKAFQTEAIRNPFGDSVALLLDSPGGDPGSAFRIARLFQRRVKRFVILVPQYAKSASTLIALGANELILGSEAELGPLDLQVYDTRREEYGSALNAVQSLERLGAHALSVMDQTMLLLIRRMKKKSDILLPQAFQHAANLLKPLLEKVDPVEYAAKSRDLKVAEEYAARLMRKEYGFARGRAIARKLVENYPAHGFVIDRDETIADDASAESPENAFGLGLKATEAEQNVQDLFNVMMPFLDSITAIGRIEEVGNV